MKNEIPNRNPDFHYIVKKKSENEVAQSCPTLCDPMDCNLPGSSVHGIFKARVLEWVVISFSREPSQPREGFSHRHFGLFFPIITFFISGLFIIIDELILIYY